MAGAGNVAGRTVIAIVIIRKVELCGRTRPGKLSPNLRVITSAARVGHINDNYRKNYANNSNGNQKFYQGKARLVGGQAFFSFCHYGQETSPPRRLAGICLEAPVLSTHQAAVVVDKSNAETA